MSNITLLLSLVLMSALLPTSPSSNEEVPANEDEATQSATLAGWRSSSWESSEANPARRTLS
jgi:hypothetical protein